MSYEKSLTGVGVVRSSLLMKDFPKVKNHTIKKVNSLSFIHTSVKRVVNSVIVRGTIRDKKNLMTGKPIEIEFKLTETPSVRFICQCRTTPLYPSHSSPS